MRKKESEFVNHLKKLLDKIDTHTKLAKSVGASASRIPEWMKGDRLPSSDTLIKLGGVALELGLPDPFFFWALAGVDTQTLRKMADRVQERQYELAGPTVPIARFRETEHGREDAGPPVPLPLEFVPNPGTTICLDISDESFGVVDAPHGLIILDTCVLGTADVRALDGRVVMVRYEPESPSVLNKRGLYMGRLRIELMQHGRRHDWMQITVKLLSLSPWTPLWITLGLYEDPQGLRGIPYNYENDEARSRRLNEILARVGSNFPLAEGVQIMALVLGRLTGNRDTTVPNFAYHK